MLRLMFAAAVALAFGACATRPVDENHPLFATQGRDTCGYHKYKHLIGQPVSAPGVPGASTANVSFYQEPDYVRLTMLIPANLGIYVGEDGIIRRMACG